MNTYMKLKFHHERNVYKRGQYKGDAPAGKRWRNYVRVIKGNNDTMRVRMYGTDLLTAYPDGRVEIDTGGWYDRPTTKLRLNEAFSFLPVRVALYSQKVFGMSQPVLSVNGKRVLYYDGITVDNAGEILTPLRSFERRRVDRNETKALREEMAECGFKDVFNVLWATCKPEDAGYPTNLLRSVVTHEYHSNHWVNVVAAHTWSHRWDFSQGAKRIHVKNEPQEAWASLMNTLRRDCYEVVSTETTTL